MKSLKLSELTQGLNHLKKLGHSTLQFTSRGVEFQLRTITRDELQFANEYAAPLLAEAEEADTSFALTAWIQAIKIGTLSFAIMKIGEMDFNGVSQIVNDSDPHNVESIQKHIFVRSLIEGWEDSLLNILQSKFQEVTEQAEEESKKGVVFLNKTQEEILADLEEEAADMRMNMGLPPLSLEGSPSGGLNSPLEGDGKSPSISTLKEALMTPVENTQYEEREGYMYERNDAVSEIPQSSEKTVTYDEVSLEQERLYQQRAERTPLNTVPVNVHQGNSTLNAYPNQGSEVSEPEIEVLRPNQPQSSPVLNSTPKGKGNPKFYSPGQKP